jgi:hypothetical protein
MNRIFVFRSDKIMFFYAAWADGSKSSDVLPYGSKVADILISRICQNQLTPEDLTYEYPADDWETMQEWQSDFDFAVLKLDHVLTSEYEAEPKSVVI